ncbi:MAG: hypothetical protein QG574_5416 [Cyanobacteriota bacterium erpe_2018_sw_21hr_WHONDRS-SW48-000092_B_bin.40]|nr:hypothetical protein [Cyanobacteriota bacterium erpe_2018_sw_21hr_WHONDRS-SW48-000092_B_bin.40]
MKLSTIINFASERSWIIPSGSKRLWSATMLRCPSCQKCVSPLQVLEHCSVSWPDQQWLLFECPICTKHSHVQVRDGLLELGELDGTPGPCFCADTCPSAEPRGSGRKVNMISYESGRCGDGALLRR